MRELVSTIQSLLGKIEEGNITQAEMEQLVADARELNERLIVLRYKVYEQGIFEVQPTAEQELEIELPEIELNLEITDEPQVDLFDENVESKDSEKLNEDQTLSEALNNFIGDLETEEIESINNISKDAEAETTFENPSNFEMFPNETPFEEPSIGLNFEEGENDEQEDEQIIEESTLITSSFDEETNVETQEITHHQTSVIESEESTTIIETEETTKITVLENPVEEREEQSDEPIYSGNSEMENKLKSIEKNLRINYSIVPLETLIGSFTLNERLQFINELFEGSSDSFSSAVKKLDALDGLDSARLVIADFASTNNWDLDNEIVEDFLVKICRRYA